MTAKNLHAVALGKLGGRAKTPRKQAASRENGRKGGRPRKLPPPPGQIQPPPILVR